MTNNSRRAAKSVILITAFSLLSKLLGFLREILIAAKYGSGVETDTFFVAFSATLLLTNFFKEAIRTTFIPVISEVESKEGIQGKLEHTNNMINVTFFFSSIVVILGMIATPILVKLLAVGFTGDQANLAIRLTRIGLPSVVFSGVVGVIIGYLQSEGKFNTTAILGIPLNLAYIFFLLFLSKYFSIAGLMVALVVGTILQILLQIPEARALGFKYKPIFDLKDKYIKRMLYLSIPVLISVGINDLNAIVDKTLASTLIDGSISALNYSYKLIQLILGVFITAITTVIFPMLSKEANQGNMTGVKKTMAYGVNIVLLISIPAAIGMTVLAKPIIEIAFQRGQFTASDTIMTSQALIAYSVGLVSMALRLLGNNVYYAIQDTKTPMKNGAISVGANIVFNLILIRSLAHVGLALGTTIATTIGMVILFYGLNKKIGSIGIGEYFKVGFKIGLASIIMGAVAYFTYYGLYGMLGVSSLYKLISLIVAVGLAVIVYVVLCYALKIEEVRDFIEKAKERLLKIQ